MQLKQVHLATMLAAIVIVSGAFAQRAVMFEPTAPQPGSSPVVLKPYAELMGVYDDNITRASDNTIDDIYGQATAGLRLQYVGSMISLTGAGFVSRRAYHDTSRLDFTSVGQALQLQYGHRDQYEIRIRQGIRRIEDTDTHGSDTVVGNVSPDSALDVASSSERTIMQVSALVGKNVTDKSEVDASYRFDSVDYEASQLLTLRTQTAQLEAATALTDKSAVILVLRGGLQSLESLDDDADFYAAQIGVKTRSTEKLRLRAAGGFQQYNRPGDADSIDAASFDIQALLAATDKVTLRAGSRNGTQLSSSVRGNTTEFTTVFIGASLQASTALRISANAAYREDEYVDTVIINGVPTDRTDKGTSLSLRAAYQTMSEMLKVISEISYSDIDSDAGDYDQTRVSIAAQLQF